MHVHRLHHLLINPMRSLSKRERERIDKSSVHIFLLNISLITVKWSKSFSLLIFLTYYTKRLYVKVCKKFFVSSKKSQRIWWGIWVKQSTVESRFLKNPPKFSKSTVVVSLYLPRYLELPTSWNPNFSNHFASLGDFRNWDSTGAHFKYVGILLLLYSFTHVVSVFFLMIF